MKLLAGETITPVARYSSADGGIVRGRIVNIKNIRDSLSTDNTAQSVLPEILKLDILYYGEDESYLKKVLQAQQNIKFTRIDEIPETLPEKALLVLYRNFPSNLPDGNIIMVNPQIDTSLFTVGEKVDTSALEIFNSDAPMMKSVRFDHVQLGDVRHISFLDGEKSDIFVQTPQSPVLFFVRPIDNPLSEWLVMNFSADDGALPLRTVFPILFANAVESFRAKMSLEDEEHGAFNIQERIQIKLQSEDVPLRAVSSEGKEIKLAGRDSSTVISTPTHAGIIAINNENGNRIRQVAVNLCSPAESNLSPKTLPDAIAASETFTAGFMRNPLWTIFAAAALALLILEWHFYHRRWTE